jgi:hypothetical protein
MPSQTTDIGFQQSYLPNALAVLPDPGFSHGSVKIQRVKIVSDRRGTSEVAAASVGDQS